MNRFANLKNIQKSFPHFQVTTVRFLGVYLSTSLLEKMSRSMQETKKWLRDMFLWLFLDTLPETNIAPKNGWLEDEFPFGKASCQVPC